MGTTNDSLLMVEGCKNTNIVTVLIRAGNDMMVQEAKKAIRIRQSTGGMSANPLISLKSITGMSSRNVKRPRALVTSFVKRPIFTDPQPSATRRKRGAQSATWCRKSCMGEFLGKRSASSKYALER